MNFRLVIPRERPEKDIQIFAPNMVNLRQAASVALANLPDGALANLYQTKEERIGVVRIQRSKEKVYLVPVQLDLVGKEERAEKDETAKEEKANETGKAGNEAGSPADGNAGK